MQQRVSPTSIQTSGPDSMASAWRHVIVHEEEVEPLAGSASQRLK